MEAPRNCCTSLPFGEDWETRPNYDWHTWGRVGICTPRIMVRLRMGIESGSRNWWILDAIKENPRTRCLLRFAVLSDDAAVLASLFNGLANHMDKSSSRLKPLECRFG